MFSPFISVITVLQHEIRMFGGPVVALPTFRSRSFSTISVFLSTVR